ncbi:MAG: polyphenol oxidase family protein [Bacteriovorax sp.]|nr:polyphenol oxidase family protein [Bacteriovorax sp.]
MAEASIVFEKELPRGKFFIYRNPPVFPLLKVKQTHSNIVLDEGHCQEAIGDAIVGQSKTPMAILTADCLPILLLGESGHAFVHAGWKGLDNHILKNELIQNIKPTYAFIGPHISRKHYEVQADFREHFPYPEAFHEQEGKLFFSLLKMACIQLETLYPRITIEESGKCTFENEELYSFRRNKTTLRNWNLYIP